MTQLTHSQGRGRAQTAGRPNIPHAVAGLIEQYRRFLRTSYRFADEDLRRQFDEHLATADVVVKGPYVTLARDFVRGRSLEALVAAGECDADLLKANWAFGRERLYLHQERALQAGRAGRSLVVTTGTGSGKTEAFLLPLLDGIVRRKREGRAGVQGVLLYPMNALANDQLERLRRLLRGSGLDLSFGLYTGDSDTTSRSLSEDPAENERLGRDAIRRNPPDLLLTNYKQLEFLLVRKDDRGLFGPALRWLVLDELHSYRGALATEIACLIRRLKAHADLPPGTLRAFGTSATVSSGPGGAATLAAFATTLIGEKMGVEDVIGEALVEPADAAPRYVPPAPTVDAGALAAVDTASDDAVARLAEQLTGRRCPATGFIAERVGAVLGGNAVVRDLEQAAGSITSLEQLVAGLRESLPERATSSDDELRREVEGYLLVGSVGDELHPPRLRPKLHTFFHGVYDVALCLDPGCRRLVPHGGSHCLTCRSHAWPAALCRTCGQDFVKIRFPSSDSSSPVGSGDFQSDESTAFLTHRIRELVHAEDGDDADADDAADGGSATLPAADPPKGWERIGVCPRCGVIGKLGAPCSRCDKPAMPMLMHRGDLHTCPACGDMRTRGDIVTPLRTGTASSVSVLTTHHLDELQGADRKLLVFTDNRQDAAHQAGYTEDKHRVFALRHLVTAQLKAQPDHGLHLTQLPGLLFDAYQRLGFIGSKPAKPERDRWTIGLTWLVANEFTRNIRQRMALEQLGLVAVDYEFLDDLAADERFVRAGAAAGIEPGTAVDLARATLDIMRRNAAVSFEFFQEYIDPNRKHQYRELEAEPFRISFSDRDRKPRAYALDRPDHIRKAKRVEGIVQEHGSRGQPPGAHKLAAKVIGDRSRAEAFLRSVMPLLEEHGLIEAVPSFPIPAKERTQVLRPLQIRRDVIRLRLVDSGFRCPACQAWRPYRLEHCASPRCKGGAPRPAGVDADNYYVRLYRDRPPQRLLVREHSAQIDAKTRVERETAFKSGRIDALVCTPTLELGVDIGPLLTVLLRRAPPTPANYAQRVGRAGRRLRIGFASTFCVGSPHDRHVFESPEWLVAGRFDPPRLRLDNKRIAHRHLRSYLLSNLSCELPQLMGHFLDDLVAPTTWRTEMLQPLMDESRTRRDALIARLFRVFSPDRESGRTRSFDEDEVARVVDGFAGALSAAVEEWWQRVRRLDREFHDFSKVGSPRHDKQKASARQHAYRELTQDHERAYTLNYLSTRDVLPAYQFPLDSFTLDPGVTDTPQLYRPAGIAIEEFAPGNFVYANGHKLKSIRVLFAGGSGRHATSGGTDAERAGRIRGYHFCTVCDQAVDAPANACPRCKSPLDPAIETLFVDSFEAEESLRIGSDEESRQRQYHDRRNHLLVRDEQDCRLYPYPLAPVELVPQAGILVTNWGRKPWRAKEGERFSICPECGRYSSINPRTMGSNKALAKRLGEERARHARFCAGQHAELILGYQYAADALVIGLPTRGYVEDGQSASASPLLVTMTEALISGATVLLELEPGELSAFPRRSPPGRQGDEIVIFENVPGGAGYVEEVARRLPAVAAASMARLYNHDCERACYLCLKHYRNQGWHAAFDKQEVREVLRAIAALDRVEPQAARPGASCIALERMLLDRGAEITAQAYPKGEIEELLLAELDRMPGMTRGLRDHEVKDEHGRLVTVPDFAWPDVRLAVYCDGYAYHGNVETLAMDAKKRNWLQKHGWIVLTFWGRTIKRDARGCAADVADALRRGVRALDS